MINETTTPEFDYAKEIWDVADLIRGPIKTSEYNRVSRRVSRYMRYSFHNPKSKKEKIILY